MTTWTPTDHAVDRFVERVDQTLSIPQARHYLENVWPERCFPLRDKTRAGHHRWRLRDYENCELVTKRDRPGGEVFVVTALGPAEVVREQSQLPEQWELEEMVRLYYQDAPNHPASLVADIPGSTESAKLASAMSQIQGLQNAKFWTKTANAMMELHKRREQGALKADRQMVRGKLSQALRVAVKALQRGGDYYALAEIAKLRQWYVSEEFLSGEEAPKTLRTGEVPVSEQEEEPNA